MGSTPSQIANNISSAISSTMIQSITNATNNILTSQNLDFGCPSSPNTDGSGGYYSCIETTCKNEPSCIDTKCKPIVELCTSQNISVKQLCMYDITQKAYTTIDVQTQNNINTILSQYSKDSTSNQLINNIGKQIVADDITSQILKKFNNSKYQNIIIKDPSSTNDISLNNVSLEQSVNITVNDIINVNKTASIIKNLSIHISQIETGPYNTLLHACVVFVAVFVAIFVILFITKSHSFQDFIKNFLPYLIWFFISVIITFIYILSKPSYVCDFPSDPSSDQDKYNRRTINVSKTIGVLAIWYTSIAIIITSVFVIIKIHKNKKK